MTLPELNLLVLKVRDVEACCAFYASLGLQLIRERHGEGQSTFQRKLEAEGSSSYIPRVPVQHQHTCA